MKLVPPFLALVLTLSVTAGALQAPGFDPDAGGLVLITYCAEDGKGLEAADDLRHHIFELQREQAETAEVRGLQEQKPAHVARATAEELLSQLEQGSPSAMIFADYEGREVRDPEFQEITVIEIWSPECGDMPLTCRSSRGYNIVPLGGRDYLFQEVDAMGRSTGAFFRGAGFWTSCGNEGALFRERILLAANDDLSLHDLERDFAAATAVPPAARELPRITYYQTGDDDTGLAVAFEEDRQALAAYYHGYEYDDFANTWKRSLSDDRPIPMTIYDGAGLGDLAPLLLKGAIDPNGVRSRVTVVASADAAFDRLDEGGTDGLAYQMFARLAGQGGKTIERRDVSECRGLATFSYEFENVTVIKEGGKLYLGENGIICMYPDEKGTPYAYYMEAESAGACESEVLDLAGDTMEGNCRAYGLLEELAGGFTFLSGLSACATYEMARSKEAYPDRDRSEVPLCEELLGKKSDIDQVECPVAKKGLKANKKRLFGSGGYCACAGEAEGEDMMLAEERLFAPGAPLELPGPEAELFISGGPMVEREASGSAIVTWTFSRAFSDPALLVSRKGVLLPSYEVDTLEKSSDGVAWAARIDGLDRSTEYDFGVWDGTEGREGFIPDQRGESMWEMEPTYAGPEPEGISVVAGPSVSRSPDGKSAVITWKTDRPAEDQVKQLPLYWETGDSSTLAYPKDVPEGSGRSDWTVELTGLKEDEAYNFQIYLLTGNWEKLEGGSGVIAAEKGQRSVRDSTRMEVSESPTARLLSSSTYMVRMEPGLTRSGVAYQILPDAMSFDSPVSLELERDGSDFHASSGLRIYRYEDSEIEGDCEYQVLDAASKVVGPGGGMLELDDLTLTFGTTSLPEDTEVTVRKLQLDCPDLLVAEEVPDIMVTRVLEGALEEPEEEAPPPDDTLLVLVIVVAALAALHFLKRPKKK